jgi:hypothetical protein
MANGRSDGFQLSLQVLSSPVPFMRGTLLVSTSFSEHPTSVSQAVLLDAQSSLERNKSQEQQELLS